MLGVNQLAHEPGELKEVMERDDITWRTFDDNGDIVRQWNSPATPAFYVIDHEGIIRRKWVGGSPGEAAIDAVLESLIQEAEEAN